MNQTTMGLKRCKHQVKSDLGIAFESDHYGIETVLHSVHYVIVECSLNQTTMGLKPGDGYEHHVKQLNFESDHYGIETSNTHYGGPVTNQALNQTTMGLKHQTATILTDLSSVL